MPAAYLINRFGVDFAQVVQADGSAADVVVRRGEPVTVDGMENAVEVLSGLAPGDRLALPAAAP